MSARKPALSCIIITLNEEKVLPILLDSLKKQTFKNFEIIVADYNSKDKTREIAKKYGCKITLGGKQSFARNNGARIAKGDYLLFLDADTKLPKDFIKINLKKLKESGAGVGTVPLKPLSNNLFDKFLFEIYNCWTIALSSFSPHSTGASMFVRKEIFKKLQGFNEKIIIGEDHDFAKRAKKYGFVILPKETYTSVRRIKKDGRINYAFKLAYMGIYRVLFGKEIKKKIVKYDNVR